MSYLNSNLARVIVVSLLICLAAIIIASDTLFAKAESVMAYSESYIYHYPITGMLLFIILASISAMVAFYSSTVLVPIGIYVWGELGCIILLWFGWLTGGVLTYLIGSSVGRSIIMKIVGMKKYRKYESFIGEKAKFIHILIFQAVVPSELPGYFLGSIRYKFTHYITALAIVEMPYAILTIILGSSFLQRNTIIFISTVLLALLATYLTYYYVTRTNSLG